MSNELTPSQLQKVRRILLFAIFLAVMDVCIIVALLYGGAIELPH